MTTEESSPVLRRSAPVAMAVAACLPWLALRALGRAPDLPWTLVLPGLCIVGAAFMMTWAAEVLELDLPQNVAIGIVALIAVLPEYAVDMYFAWTAGRNPAYTAYATANMTGANRLLIGLGWPVVLLTFWWKSGERAISLSRDNAVELMALLAATVYAFVLPLKRGLSCIDSVVFLAIFAAYAYRSSQAHAGEPELEGTAAFLAELPPRPRRVAVAAIFLFAAVAIGLSAQPFAEGILGEGRRWGIEEFLLVQWLAPLASEAPEFIVAMVFASRGKPEVGLRALVSSKVNQWTLLVGMIPLAYCASAGGLSPMPLDERQAEEIVLTAAQSLFGLAFLIDLKFTIGEALALLVLFAAQMVFQAPGARWGFAGLYLVLSAGLFFRRGNGRSLRDLAAFALKTP